MAKKVFPTKWDLSELYSGINDPHIDKDLQKLAADTKKFAQKHTGKLKSYTPAQLKKMLQEDEALETVGYKIDLYVSLCSSLNTLDGAIAALEQKVAFQLTTNYNQTLFVSLELAKHTKLKELATSKVMGVYAIIFQNLLQRRKHQLDEPREQLLNMKAIPAHNGWRDMSEKLNSKIRVELPDAKDKKKSKLVRLETAIDMLHEADKTKRYGAGAAATKAFKENQELHTHIYSMILTNKMQNDSVRGFTNPEDVQHMGNNLDPKAVAALQSIVDANTSLVSRYYTIKRKLLGMKRLNEYDRYVPLEATKRSYSYGEGVAMVEEAFREFDSEFADYFIEFVNNGHIDVLPSHAKRGGAFCAYAAVQGLPYIFLNYFNKAGDVQTLAHEAGHGIHSMFANALPISVRYAPIAMAETASVFGEMLLFQKLYNGLKTNAEKIALLSGTIEAHFATIFRQMFMYRFEQLAHGAMKKNGQISAVELQGFWLETQRAMFGDSLEITDDYKYWWQGIPHFLDRPFYVYGYSFGGLLVLALYESYKREGKSFIPKYKRFLALGGSKTPQEAVQEFGFDLSDPTFWQSGMEPLREMIDLLESLV